MTDYELFSKYFKNENGIIYRIKSYSSTAKIGVAGWISDQNYVLIAFRKKIYRAHRIAWLLHYKEWPKQDIDHINRNKLDNCIENLRLCTDSQNAMNVGLTKRNKSGHKGVHWNKKINKWTANIWLKKCIYLGDYKNIEDAIKARKIAEEKYFGEFNYKE